MTTGEGYELGTRIDPAVMYCWVAMFVIWLLTAACAVLGIFGKKKKSRQEIGRWYRANFFTHRGVDRSIKVSKLLGP